MPPVHPKEMAESPNPEQSTQSTSSDKMTWLQQFSLALDGSLQWFFGHLGYQVALRPWLTIALSVLVVALCSIGTLRYDEETDTSELWTPRGSQVKEQLEFVGDNFPSAVFVTNFIVTGPNEEVSDNLLTYDILKQLVDVRKRTEALSAKAQYKDEKERTYTFDEVCSKKVPIWGGEAECEWNGAPSFWEWNVTKMEMDEAAGRSPGEVIADRIANASTPSASGLWSAEVARFFSAVSRDENGLLTEAKVLKLTYALVNNEYEGPDGGKIDPVAEAIEEATALEFHAADPSKQEYDDFTLLLSNGWWTSNEFGRAIRGDLAFVGASIMLIVLYLVIQTRVGCSCVGMRVGLSVAGALTVGLAIGISYGLGSAASQYTSVHSVLPFVLAGIGVDDLFVVVNEFGLADPRKPLPERVAEAMRHAGPSMTTTSMTDFLAFMIGATTSLPALSSFCIWAAFAIIGVFFLSCTFFTACLVLDFQRQRAGRLDCLCCVRGNIDDNLRAFLGEDDEEQTPSKQNPTVSKAPNSQTDEEKALPESQNPMRVVANKDVEKGQDDFGEESIQKSSKSSIQAPTKFPGWLSSGVMRYFIARVYAPFLLHPYTKVAVLVLFVGITAVGGYGASQLTQEFRQEWFIPADSELLVYNDINNKYFLNGGPPVAAYVVDVDVFNYPTLLNGLDEALAGSDYTPDSPVSNWWTSFSSFAGDQATIEAMNRTTFDETLQAWYAAGLSERFRDDLVFEDGVSSKLKATRVRGFFKDFDSSAEEVDAMQDVRKRVLDAADDAGFDGRVFAFSFSFLLWEQTVVIPQEAIQNLGLAILAVAVVVLVVVAHPFMALLLALMISVVLLDILGYGALWDVALNGVSVVNLVLAVGLAVDYGAHIAHAFMHKHGTRDERATKAITEMGISVINGGISTFLAVLVLSGSDSYIFQIFFREFFLSVVFGLAHGLVLLPVILSLIGPDSHKDVHASVSEKHKTTE